MRTLIDLFETFSDRNDSTAIVFRTGVRRYTYTYRQLHDLSLRMAAWLERMGVKEGDRVILWGPNSPWWGVAFWGILARGAVVVPVDFMSGRDRAEAIANLSGASLIIQSRLKIERMPGERGVFMEDLPFLLKNLAPTVPAAPSPDDMAQLVYTSGTTGNPKGVILTHRNLVANLLQVNRHLPIVTSQFTFLSLLPMSHMFEQMAGFLTPLYRGGAIVYLPVLKPSAIMEALGEEDIYAVILVPRLLQLLKGSIERELDSKHLAGLFRFLAGVGRSLPLSLRRLLFFPIQKKFGRNFTLFVSGGAALDPNVAQFWEEMGFVVVEGYGLSECSPVVAANTIDRRVIGTVGTVLPGVEVKIQEKEIYVRGDNVFPGYYGNDAATREAITQDGWFRTGDMGEFDQDDNLCIKGRSKELIVTGGGVNVYPDEIEAILNGIQGVRESCVIGMDRGAGEEVHAVIIPDGSGRPLQQAIEEANSKLDSLHHITGLSLWPEPEFPKTTTLKIQKFKVKEHLKLLATGGEGIAKVDPLVSLIARITASDPIQVREDSLLVSDLGLTSIARLELVNAIEVEYRLDLEDTAIGPATRVSDLRQMIARREKKGDGAHLRLWANSSPVRFMRMMLDRLLHFPLIRLYVSLEVQGWENARSVKGPVLFISNHLSYLDQPVIMMAMSSRWRYVTATAAWEEFFFPQGKTWPVRLWKRITFEYGCLGLNLFPLPQSRGFRQALRHMGSLVDREINILLFPEGERSRSGSLLPFQLGMGLMVRELGVPVVPIKIEGLEKVFPRGAVWPKRGKVKVKFGKPIFFKQEQAGEIVERSRQAVENL